MGLSPVEPTPTSAFLSPTLGHAVRFMWAWVWRWVLFGLGAVIVVNVPLMGLSLMAGGSSTATDVVSLLGSFLVVFGAQVYTLWNILDKDFSGFGVRLMEVASEARSGSEPVFVAPTLGHAARVWWAFTWRQALWSIPFSLPIVIVFLFIARLVGLPEQWLGSLTPGLGFLPERGVGVFVLKRVFRKEFRHFRICLISH